MKTVVENHREMAVVEAGQTENVLKADVEKARHERPRILQQRQMRWARRRAYA